MEFIAEFRAAAKEKPAVRSVTLVFAVFFANGFLEAVMQGIGYAAVATTIVCDAAPIPGDFSGSPSCGDRNIVSSEAIQLILTGYGFESVLATFWFFFDVVLIECVHRKRLLHGVLLNDLMVQGFLAIFCGGYLTGNFRKYAYIANHFVHACSPTQVLIDTVFLDLTEGDIYLRKRGYMVKEAIVAITGTIAPITVVFILRLQITNYSPIFCFFAILQVVGMIALYSFNIECDAIKPKSKLSVQAVWKKFISAISLLKDPTVQMPAVKTFMNGSVGYAFHVSNYIASSHLKWPQEAFGTISIIAGFVTMPLGFLQWKLAAQFGERKYLGFMFFCEAFFTYCSAPLLPTTSAGFIVAFFAYFINISLMKSVALTAESLMPHFREQIRCEVTLLFKSLGSAGGVVASFSMRHLIGWNNGVSYWDRVIPFLPTIIIRVVRDFVLYRYIWPGQAKGCDIITEHRQKGDVPKKEETVEEKENAVKEETDKKED